jgi:predicted transcriptional regulator YheO
MSKASKISDKEIFSHYIKMGEILSKMFNPNLEVIVHDLRYPEHSIIAIFNNHITGGKIKYGR